MPLEVFVLKDILSEIAHSCLRRKVHETVAVLPLPEVRSRIHWQAPVLGRVYTLLASEEAQRAKIHGRIDRLSNRGLREAARDRLPGAVQGVLAWLDDDGG